MNNFNKFIWFECELIWIQSAVTPTAITTITTAITAIVTIIVHVILLLLYRLLGKRSWKPARQNHQHLEDLPVRIIIIIIIIISVVFISFSLIASKFCFYGDLIVSFPILYMYIKKA